MADGLSAFGLPPQQNAPPLPPPAPIQPNYPIAAPGTVSPGAQPFMGSQRAPIPVAAPAPAGPPVAGPPPNTGPRPGMGMPPQEELHPITLPEAVQQWSAANGRKPTAEEFDQIASDYRTNTFVPTITKVKGAKSDAIKAEEAAYDNQVQQARNYLYPVQPSTATGTAGKVVGSALQQFGARMLNNAGTAINLAGGGLAGDAAAVGVPGAAALRDYLFRGADPTAKGNGGQNMTDQQAIAQALARTGADKHLGDPRFAGMIQEIAQRAIANNQDPSASYTTNQWMKQAEQRSPTGSAVGDIGAFVASTLAGPGGTAVAAAAPAANNATQQLSDGQELSPVMKQFAVDSGLNLLLSKLAPGYGKSLLTKIITGAGIGVASGAAQQVADAEVNPNNKAPTLSDLVSQQTGTTAGIGGLLAALAHVQGVRAARTNPLKTPDSAPAAGPTPDATQPATPAAASAPEAAATPAGAAPLDAAGRWAATMAGAPETGIPDTDFAKQSKATISDFNQKAKLYASTVKNSTTPEKVVDNATALARRNPSWDSMSGDQRATLVGDMATSLAKKAGVKMDAVSDHLAGLQGAPGTEAPVEEAPAPVAPVAEAAPVQPAPLAETPLPPELTGQQPSTQVPADPIKTAAEQMTTFLTADQKTVPEQIKSNPLYQAALSAGAKTPEDVAAVLHKFNDDGSVKPTAEVTGTKISKNNLRKPKPAAPAPTANAQVDAQHEAVAKTVTDALADTSTPADTGNKLQKAAKAISQKRYNQEYLSTLMNDGEPTQAEAKYRNDPSFTQARAAMRKGEITSADSLGDWLTAHRASNETASFGDQAKAASDANGNKQMGALLGAKSVKADVVVARKHARDVHDALVKLGEDSKTIKSMTLDGAQKMLQRRLNGDIGAEPLPEPVKTSKVLKQKAPKPAATPKEDVASVDPLEQSLRERLGDKLSLKATDDLYNNLTEARGGGDAGNLYDSLTGLLKSGDIDKEDAKWLRKLAKGDVAHDLIENNASGESSASLEAQHRLADEKANGQTRAVIGRDGKVRALHGVDAVDTHARTGEVIVQRNIGKDKWTVLSHGDDVSPEVAKGKLNRSLSDLEDLHHGVDTGFAGEDDHTPFGEHTLNMDDVEELNDYRDAARKGAPDTIEKSSPISAKREVNKVIEGIRKGDTVQEAGEKLTALKEKLEQKRNEQLMREAFREKQRGTDYIRSRLYKMIHEGVSNDHADAGDFANWLLDQNPRLGNDLGISIHKMEGGVAGSYDPLARIIHLNSTDINSGTAVHEILHSSESLMPKELQDKIHAEYISRLGNKLKQATADGNRWAKLYLQAAMHNYVKPNVESRNVMNNILKKYRSEVPVKDYYKYYDPSEYFANEGTDILQRKFENDGWVGKVKEYVTQLVQHLKNLFGWDNNSAVYKGIQNALDTNGKDRSSGMLSKRSNARDIAGGEAEDANRFQDIHDEGEGEESATEPTEENLGYEPTPKAPDDAYLNTSTPKEQAQEQKSNAKEITQTAGNVGNGQRFWEQVAKAGYGLEKAMQEYRGKGIKITPENNVDDAQYTKNGLSNEYASRDFDEVVAPVDNYLSKNWSKFAKTKGEFLDHLNTFFGNMNFIERIKSDHLENAPLNNGAEIDRAEIIDKVAKGDLTPAKGRAELQRLMKDNGSVTWQDWAEQQKVPLDKLQANLKDLKSRGIDEKSMGDLNGLMDNVRARQRQRLENAGIVAKDDPWVDFYGWKWYVPLKGSPEDALSNNFDLASRQGSLRVLNTQLQAMEGRKSEGERPFSRLFVDTSRAAERHANSYFLDRVYNLAAEHGKEIGAKIYPFDGRPRDGYTNEKGQHFDQLNAPKNGVIVHDGNQHYVITLPKDSQLLRGLVQMNNVERPNVVDRTVGKGTHILSRLYTTVHPAWQTFSGFARDLTYTPITLAATKFSNPLDAIPFWKNYSGNVLKAYSALPDMIPTLMGKHNQLRAKGETDPNSWAGWTQRYMGAGGSNAFSHVFDVKSLENQFTNKFADARPGAGGVVDMGKFGWEQVLKYTGNYANFMEAIPRVAAFRTLVENGASEHDAATQVRKLLDYSESGIKGRRINSYLAFFRVGATGVDAMRRAFTKPTGGIDFAKAAKWQAFMGALGAVGYMTANLMLGKDDDGTDKIAKLKPETIGTKILIPLPGGQTGGISLGLGLPQIMLSVGALGAAVAHGHQSMEDAAKAYISILARNSAIAPGGIKDVTPTNVVSALLGGLVPTVARPVVDVATNTNSFGTSIHNDSQDSKAYHSDQGRNSTPKEYKEMANFLRQVTGGTVDYYPEDIRYLIQNYGGQWGTDIMKTIVSDPNKAAGAGDEPNRMASHFIVSDANFYMQDQLYKTMDNLGDSVKRYNHVVQTAIADGATKDQAQTQAQQMVSRDSSMRAEMQAYGQLQQAVKAYNAGLTDLRQNKLVSDQRKQLVRKQLDSTLRQAVMKAQGAEH